jgi:hypothetical protein
MVAKEKGVRISSGAPLAYKTANVRTRTLAPGDHLLQSCLIANDPDRMIVGLDPIHD